MGVDHALKGGNSENVLEMLLNEKEKWPDRLRRETKVEVLLTLARHRSGTQSVKRLTRLLETVTDQERIDEITR